ncbi:MAG TPA: M28 family peptidase [Myxococcales bacterium]|nr:M28 family peptidase [Myxococcales bacterium]
MPLSALSPLFALLVAAPARPNAAQTAAASPQPVRAQGRFTTSERAAMARITPASISGPLRFLSDDLLEGRKPGSTGADLAVKYLAAELEGAGYLPGVPASPGSPQPSFFQPVPLITLHGHPPKQVPFQGPGGQLELSALAGVDSDLRIDPDAHVELAKVKDAELVFVGYGIVAPEYGWDDYKDADLRGKIAVILNFNPPFAGEGVRLWYGRWDYKYLTAAAHGAAGALVIHTTASAGYPWQVLSASSDSTRIDLPPGSEHRMQFQGWVTEDGAKKMTALANLDLDKLRADAQQKSFQPVPLGVRTSFDMPIDRQVTPSANVVGLLPGTDPQLKNEAVVFTAHWDHLGRDSRVPPGKDGIYNGALDNASGCALMLSVARAAKEAPPKRSLLFVFVTAEEQGLLGSKWFAQHPTVPAGRIAANINADSVNRWGRTTDVGLLGLGKSSLDAVVREVAAEQGRSVHGDPFPDRGAFYRSDQFELARVGVPVVYARGGPSFIGRPPGWGQQMQEEFERRDYHQVTDEYHGDWDLSGAVEDAQLDLVVGLRVANSPTMPQWTPGDEFEKARKTAAR